MTLDAARFAEASLAELSAARRLLVDDDAVDAGVVEAYARRAIALGEPLLAWDAVSQFRARPQAHATLPQVAAFALLRAGSPDRAISILEPLWQEGAVDEETVGLLARAHKAIWRETGDARHLGRSLVLYAQAWERTGGIWSGINAATLSLCAGSVPRAVEIARDVEAKCAAELGKGGVPDPWVRGTQGEAAVVLGRIGDAQRIYAALATECDDYGTLASVRANARLALRARSESAAWLEECLPSPVVAVCTGHIPDAASEPSGHVLGAPEPELAARVAGVLQSLEVDIGFASAAAGADILFHEALRDLRAESHVVLPQPPGQFRLQSVAPAGEEWVQRFDAVLANAASTVVLGDSAPDDLAYVYANRAMLGLARLRAQQVDGRVRGLALWDGREGASGGTASAMLDWRAAGVDVTTLEVSRKRVPKAAPSRGAFPRRRIVAMLFADAVGFSKLADPAVPAFVEVFLGGVARTLAETGIVPLAKNTWGDGLYVCFDSARAAGRYALALRDRMNEVDWAADGLPADMNIRIGLHCGPAFEIHDPVIGAMGYTGAQVSRAARIEPITPPGEVYASQPFAAMVCYEGVPDLRCEYVGNMPMAKGFGQFPTYAVRRNRAG